MHGAGFYRGSQAINRRLLLGALALICGLAQAAEEPEATAKPPPRSWDAVLGFMTSYAPEYPGAQRRRIGVTPGGWLRWGRVSIASRSTFVARSGEPVSSGGLRFDLSPSERLRIGLSLRHDGGRDESESADLRGLGDVRATLRVRLSVSYPLDNGWRLASSWTVDALGHGGGTIGDVSVSRSVPLAATTSGGFSVTTSVGNRRHMRSYYGVTPEQSQASGYPVYEPGAGWRDVSLSLGARHELSRHWFMFGGVSVARLVGGAAASPYVPEPLSWAASLGLAHKF